MCRRRSGAARACRLWMTGVAAHRCEGPWGNATTPYEGLPLHDVLMSVGLTVRHRQVRVCERQFCDPGSARSELALGVGALADLGLCFPHLEAFPVAPSHASSKPSIPPAHTLMGQLLGLLCASLIVLAKIHFCIYSEITLAHSIVRQGPATCHPLGRKQQWQRNCPCLWVGVLVRERD